MQINNPPMQIQNHMTAPPTKISINRSPSRLGFILIVLLLGCFALSQRAQAVSPPPPGGYPNFTTAAGDHALQALTFGVGNTAIGTFSLFSVTTGSFNTAVGAGSLDLNTADSNTATGTAALLFNTTGAENTANGTAALEFNETASNNTANGGFALFSNDSSGSGLANNNTAVGGSALFNNVDGSENTAVGVGTGPNVMTGFNNTYVGDFVGTLSADESSTIRIGDLSNGNGAGSLECFIGGIFNNFQPVGGTVVEVTLDLADDHLGWDIGPSQGGSAPVQRGVPARRSAPQPRERAQHQAMLNGKVEKLEATVAQQQKQIETLTAQLKDQAAQIQKVSAQFDASKPAPQVVKND
jgi:hypothetical protein